MFFPGELFLSYHAHAAFTPYTIHRRNAVRLQPDPGPGTVLPRRDLGHRTGGRIHDLGIPGGRLRRGQRRIQGLRRAVSASSFVPNLYSRRGPGPPSGSLLLVTALSGCTAGPRLTSYAPANAPHGLMIQLRLYGDDALGPRRNARPPGYDPRLSMGVKSRRGIRTRQLGPPFPQTRTTSSPKHQARCGKGFIPRSGGRPVLWRSHIIHRTDRRRGPDCSPPRTAGLPGPGRRDGGYGHVAGTHPDASFVEVLARDEKENPERGERSRVAQHGAVAGLSAQIAHPPFFRCR